ncbi:hypothetical protein B0T18DRAFT_80361 [Schizothecium vesticola]|uniref:Transmembrane protein n=1 Tax=Schizothecium vesticola TaxID=314040 RepID=A0AA40F651_9PEZI|nr:hypothetical protein B0T18DRAFT_80361 [Schizothecium vesticola]
MPSSESKVPPVLRPTHLGSPRSGGPVANCCCFFLYRPVSHFDGNSTEAAKFTSPRLVPELMSSAPADQVLLVLRNLAMYTEPVADPWFRASSQQDSRGYPAPQSSSMVAGAWFPDDVASGLGCTEQYQFCANGGCTALSGLHNQDSRPLGLSAAQRATYDVLWTSAWAANMFFVLHFLQDRFLLGRRLLHPSLISAPVAPDQWMQEAENLHNISMAVLQRRIVEYANPPDLSIRPGTRTRAFIVAPTTAVERDICYNVKTRNPVYLSFSLARLAAILLAGIMVMVVNVCLPHVVLHLRRRLAAANERSLRKSEAWTCAHMFHLHRAVLEGRSVGPWEPTEDDIPVLHDRCRLLGHVEEVGEAEQDYMMQGYGPASEARLIETGK